MIYNSAIVFSWLVCLITFCLAMANNGQRLSEIRTNCKEQSYELWHTDFYVLVFLQALIFEIAGTTFLVLTL